jgi:hypothetical protein
MLYGLGMYDCNNHDITILLIKKIKNRLNNDR